MLTTLSDALLALPGLLLVLIVLAMVPGTALGFWIGLSLVLWVEFFRLTRAATGETLASPAVQASRLLGFGSPYIFRVHIWPEIAPMMLTAAAFGTATAIMAIAALGFVSVGMRPPTPELGLMMVATSAVLARVAPVPAIAGGRHLHASSGPDTHRRKPPAMTVLSASDITVVNGADMLVSPVSLKLEPGRPLVVLGETGSGKTLLTQAVMGTLPCDLCGTGRVTVGSEILDAAAPRSFRGLWGRKIAALPQEPWLSLDPTMRARDQIAEAHRFVRALSPSQAAARADRDLAILGLAQSGGRYPHELSGGMAQRVAIAAARAGGARIVLADEPTKGLDAARRDEVADLLLSEMGPDGGLLVITHDIDLARRIGGDLMVLRAGAVVERGATAEVLATPQAACTRDLLAADPSSWPDRERCAFRGKAAIVAAEGLCVARGGRTLFRDVTFGIPPGSILGVTGPSGCGKSSLGDTLLGLLTPSAGRVTRHPDLATTAFQKLYQDPVAAFPRKRRIGDTLADVARRAGPATDRTEVLLDRLGLDPHLLARVPGAVSGGELQRLALLRILLVRPAFIFADEPTSRLDPITQAQVIALLRETAEAEDCAILLVSHDLALVRATAEATIALHGDAMALSDGSPATEGSHR